MGWPRNLHSQWLELCSGQPFLESSEIPPIASRAIPYAESRGSSWPLPPVTKTLICKDSGTEPVTDEENLVTELGSTQATIQD